MLTKTEFAYHKATLHLVGRFDFNARHDMNTAMATIFSRPQVQEIVIDLAEVSYIDSSAFGQLLIAHEKCRQQNKQLCVGGAQGYVKQIFECSNFDKHFQSVGRPAGKSPSAQQNP